LLVEEKKTNKRVFCLFPPGQEHCATTSQEISSNLASKGAASQPWSTVRLENADHCKIVQKMETFEHWQ